MKVQLMSHEHNLDQFEIVGVDEFRRLIGQHAVPPDTIMVEFSGGAPFRLRIRTPFELKGRIVDAEKHLQKIFKKAGNWSKTTDCRFSFAFQPDDNAYDILSVSWERKKESKNIVLVPDLYYTDDHGYGGFLPNHVKPWSERQDVLFWRGTTTGLRNLDRNKLEVLPRFKLCREAKGLGNLADIKFIKLVQVTNSQEREFIQKALEQGEYFGQHVPFEQFSDYKYIIQIGGNGTSWGLLKKLRLGSCILLVEGEWQNWHERCIREWEHYVPVKADLSDLQQQLDWCQAHDREAAAIAECGRALAISINYDAELHEAAESIYQRFGNL